MNFCSQLTAEDLRLLSDQQLCEVTRQYMGKEEVQEINIERIIQSVWLSFVLSHAINDTLLNTRYLQRRVISYLPLSRLKTDEETPFQLLIVICGSATSKFFDGTFKQRKYTISKSRSGYFLRKQNALNRKYLTFRRVFFSAIPCLEGEKGSAFPEKAIVDASVSGYTVLPCDRGATQLRVLDEKFFKEMTKDKWGVFKRMGGASEICAFDIPKSSFFRLKELPKEVRTVGMWPYEGESFNA